MHATWTPRAAPDAEAVWTVWDTTLEKITREHSRLRPELLLTFLAQFKGSIVQDEMFCLASLGMAAVDDALDDEADEGMSADLRQYFPLDRGKWDSFRYVVGKGRSHTRATGLLMSWFFWACTAAVACLRSDEVDRDRWSISSDTLYFLRIGFLLRKELDLVSSTLSADRRDRTLLLPVCNRPCSQVISQSLSLGGGSSATRRRPAHDGVPVQRFR